VIGMGVRSHCREEQKGERHQQRECGAAHRGIVGGLPVYAACARRRG
jgi:hypothetical protein